VEAAVNVIAIANHKGGVGKTTTTMNLGCCLAEQGNRVLLVDLDPQANTTEGFGLLAHGPQLQDILVSGGIPRLDEEAASVGQSLRARADSTPEHLLRVADRMWVIPTSLALVQAQDAIVATGPDYPFRLRALLEANRDSFDYVLIDTPAVGATVWTNLGLLAAKWVIAPSAPSDYDVRAAAKQAQFVEQYMGHANPGLRMLGVLLTMTRERSQLADAAERALDTAGLPRIPHRIPRDERGHGVRAALRQHKPLYFVEPDGRVVDAYRRVAEHVRDLLAVANAKREVALT
jgi:chromosome partitioning protein